MIDQMRNMALAPKAS